MCSGLQQFWLPFPATLPASESNSRDRLKNNICDPLYFVICTHKAINKIKRCEKCNRIGLTSNSQLLVTINTINLTFESTVIIIVTQLTIKLQLWYTRRLTRCKAFAMLKLINGRGWSWNRRGYSHVAPQWRHKLGYSVWCPYIKSVVPWQRKAKRKGKKRPWKT